MGVRLTTPAPETAELNDRIGRLKGTPADTAGQARDRAALQAMRTIPLPSALGHDGQASYKLLLAPRGVTRAEPSASKDLAGGSALLGKAKLPAGSFPPGSDAVLMREGMLNCHGGTCELVLLP